MTPSTQKLIISITQFVLYFHGSNNYDIYIFLFNLIKKKIYAKTRGKIQF